VEAETGTGTGEYGAMDGSGGRASWRGRDDESGSVASSTEDQVVGTVENDVASRLDTTRSMVVIPRLEIGGSVAEKDAMEHVAGRSLETREVTREPKHIIGTGHAFH
jgi:hypothetical protein